MKYLKSFELKKYSDFQTGQWVVPLVNKNNIGLYPYKVSGIYAPEYNSVVNGHNEISYTLKLGDDFSINVQTTDFKESELREATPYDLIEMKKRKITNRFDL